MRHLMLLWLGCLLALGSAGPAFAQKIVIDPGHGGGDPGGTGTGMQEKIVVLDVSKRFKTLLDADTADAAGGGSWTTAMTRTTDTAVSLAARSAYSNNQGADRFMSIHANAFGDPSANGIETFAFAEGGQSAALRNLVQQEMVATWGLTNRGNKVANFAVLRETAAPAVLHELAFITNATDAAKLGSPAEREKAAVAHLRAIQRHYGHAAYVPGATPPVEDTGDIAGTVVDELGPVAGATVTLAGGAEVVTKDDGSFTFTRIAAGSHSITATAPAHVQKVVELTVAKGVQSELEIELMRTTFDGDPQEPADVGGGCSTGGSSSGGLVIALALLAWRRRRA